MGPGVVRCVQKSQSFQLMYAPQTCCNSRCLEKPTTASATLKAVAGMRCAETKHYVSGKEKYRIILTFQILFGNSTNCCILMSYALCLKSFTTCYVQHAACLNAECAIFQCGTSPPPPGTDGSGMTPRPLNPISRRRRTRIR